jgi:hypothetical protein
LLTYPLGIVLGSPWLLPVLNTLPAYALLVLFLMLGRRKPALGLMLLWALTLAVVGTTVFTVWPTPVDGLVLNGPAYRQEMLHWIRTGESSEGSLALFLPQHALHLAVFVGLSVVTASLAAMTLGAVLMNYMAFYVAALAHEGLPLPFVALLGWQPWAICRIVAFVALGVALAEPLLSWLSPPTRQALASGTRRPLIVIGIVGTLLDWTLKALLAPTWGLWLRTLLP